MSNSYKISGRKQLAAMLAAGAFTFVPGLDTPANAQDGGQQNTGAQSTGQRIGDAISGQINPSAGDGQGAVERGVRRTGQGLLQGQGVGDAVQQGFREGAQSALETPSQTQSRDFNQQQPGTFPNQQFQGQQFQAPQFRGQAQAPYAGQQTIRPQYYRDPNGQLFYFNSQGARVYTQNQFSGNTQAQPRSGQYYDGIGGEQTWDSSQANNGQRKLGVNVTQQENGVRIDRVFDGTAAANADLQQGDIITEIDGEPVRSVSDVINAVNAPSADKDVELTVMREDDRQTLTASFDQQSRYQAARPAMSGQSQGSLQQQVAELRQEVTRLRQQVRSLHPETGESRNNAEQSEEDLGEMLETAVDKATDENGSAERDATTEGDAADNGDAENESASGQGEGDNPQD